MDIIHAPFADRPDNDAPIIYNARSLWQNAAVYFDEKAASAPQTQTEISTSFLDAGTQVEAYLNVRSYSDKEAVHLYFKAPPHLTIGIAGLSTSLKGQIDTMAKQVKDSGAELEIEHLSKFSEAAITEFGTSSDEEYLFISGIKYKLGLSIATTSSEERSLAVILFDSHKRPILRSAVTMLLPL